MHGELPSWAPIPTITSRSLVPAILSLQNVSASWTSIALLIHDDIHNVHVSQVSVKDSRRTQMYRPMLPVGDMSSLVRPLPREWTKRDNSAEALVSTREGNHSFI